MIDLNMELKEIKKMITKELNYIKYMKKYYFLGKKYNPLKSKTMYL
jgi:hypothetical protein